MQSLLRSKKIDSSALSRDLLTDKLNRLLTELESNSTKSGVFDIKIKLQLLLYEYLDRQRDWYLQLVTSIVSNSDPYDSNQPYFSNDHAMMQLFQKHKDELCTEYFKRSGRNTLTFDRHTFNILLETISSHFTQTLELFFPSVKLFELGIDVEALAMELVSDLRSLSSNLLSLSIPQSHQVSETLRNHKPTDYCETTEYRSNIRLWIVRSLQGTSLDRTLRSLNTAAKSACPSTHSWIRENYRWLLAQCMMVLTNIVQSELGRRQAMYLCDKRLAEVPEFPLL